LNRFNCRWHCCRGPPLAAAPGSRSLAGPSPPSFLRVAVPGPGPTPLKSTGRHRCPAFLAHRSSRQASASHPHLSLTVCLHRHRELAVDAAGIGATTTANFPSSVSSRHGAHSSIPKAPHLPCHPSVLQEPTRASLTVGVRRSSPVLDEASLPLGELHPPPPRLQISCASPPWSCMTHRQPLVPLEHGHTYPLRRLHVAPLRR
jgi:hypothetical protein